MSDRSKKTLTRRVFIGATGVGVSAAGLWAAKGRWRNIGSLRHEPDLSGATSFDDATVNTLTEFLASVFGIALSSEDRTELNGRLRYAVEHDNGWTIEYAWLAAFADEASRSAGASSFSDSSVAQREEVVRLAFANDIGWRTQRARAFFQIDGRELLRMRKWTIPHLVRLYRNSGVPWRHRGYTSWPGRPDDRLAYSRRLETSQC